MQDSSFISHSIPSPFVEGPYNTKHVTIEELQNVAEFTVLGHKTKGVISQAYAGAGNGTLGSLLYNADAKVGDYIVECVEAAANAGRFKVIDPDGDRLDDAEVGVAYNNSHLDFIISDGATDFVAGDTFTITIPTEDVWVTSLAAAKDGSQIPAAISVHDIDASSADTDGLIYTSGSFSNNVLTFGTGHSLVTVYKHLRDVGIHIQDSKDA